MSRVVERALLGRVAAAALAIAGAAQAEGREVGGLSFEQAFSARGEPVQLHYRAEFLAGGGPHSLEVWRDGDRRVKRVTDRAIATYVDHRPGDAGYRLSILDLKKKITTRIDRTNMYRIGEFADWFDLTHGLRHPKGAYRLSLAATPLRGAPRPVLPCRWYDLVQGGRATHICWSGEVRLPLLIAAADGRLVWRVAEIDRRPIKPSVFKIDDKGFVRVDANRDIESD